MVLTVLPLVSKSVPLVVSAISPTKLSCLFVMLVPSVVISPDLAPLSVSVVQMVPTLVPPLSLLAHPVELVNSIT